MHLLLLRSTQRYCGGFRRAMLAVVLSLLASPSLAQRPAEGAFAVLPGDWAGTGTIALSNGAKERIRCRATYRLEGSSSDLRLEINCTSDSYKFELQSRITYSDGAITGSWNETTRGVGGIVTGSATATQIRARAEGQTFTALLAMNTRGSRQSVSIQSPGSEMSDITIDLTRGSR
jgi:hypothetical protein